MTNPLRLEAYAMAARDVVDQLHSNASMGIHNDRVATLRAQYGWNQLPKALAVPWWKKLLAQFGQLVILILIAAAIIAGVMGEWIDTFAILIIVLLNGILGFLQEERAGRALAALRAMSTPTARVFRNGAVQKLPAKELVPGDLLQLEAGDQVPADARLITAYAVEVQEASLTGESLPAPKDADVVLSASTALGDRRNMVFKGTALTQGSATAIVTATGMQTELGRIAGMLQQSDSGPTPLQRRLTELGRILVVVCLILVAVIFSIEYLRGGGLMATLLVAISLAVAAVPEGLPAVVTIALALGLQRMVKRNALIRTLPSVETLGSVTVICTDKTGTLTRNEMTVRELCVGGQRFGVTGVGYETSGKFVQELIEDKHSSRQADDQSVVNEITCLENPDLLKLITIAATCNNASLSPAPDGLSCRVIGDPTEGALLVLAKKAGIDEGGFRKQLIAELPFDSERKAMSVILQEPQGAVMYTKGAPEVILGKCTKELQGGREHHLNDERKRQIQQSGSDMAGRALRVLAFAYRYEPVQRDGQYQETDMVFSGLAGMIDPPRDEVRAAVAVCRQAGIRSVMITGDHPATALAIGRELQIATPTCLAVTGLDLDRLTDTQLAAQAGQIAVYARVSAAHKLRIIKILKERGEVVAMTGDGVNDAPALKAADIGIAMGITGTDVTREAADMVLTDDNYTSIVHAIEEGRGIFDNIQKVVHYLLSCNAGEVMLMFVAAVLGMPLPLLAIQILWINLVTDGLPALALALEPPERDIMQRRPRPPRESVITAERGWLILYHGLLICLSALLGFWWVYADDAGNLQVARTTAFAIMAFSQLAFALVCRSQRYTLPQLGLFTNYWLFVAFAVSGALQIGVFTLPIAQQVFDVAPLSAQIWLAVIGLSLAPATLIELAKIANHVLVYP